MGVILLLRLDGGGSVEVVVDGATARVSLEGRVLAACEEESRKAAA